MAKKDVKFALGYQDELITEKNNYLVDSTTNKIGGKPNWLAAARMPHPTCKLCNRHVPLVVQIHAPLESAYQRTLYIFACVNSNCWNKSESWTCLRVQGLETTDSVPYQTSKQFSTTDWVDSADDWEDNEDEETNGNIIRNLQVNTIDVTDDYAACSYDNYGHHSGVNINITKSMQCLNLEDPNANVGGAAGVLHSPVAVAEIEDDQAENELVAVETPETAETDIYELFRQTSQLPQSNLDLVFEPWFMSVYEENLHDNSPLTEHERQLLMDYQRQEGGCLDVDDVGSTGERYEKTAPIHSDHLFHKLKSRLLLNPGQIVRYCPEDNGGYPLLLYPLREQIPKCSVCRSDMAFELQLMPTLVDKLKLQNYKETFLEFGSIIIYTCKKSCWDFQERSREEFVIVQGEVV